MSPSRDDRRLRRITFAVADSGGMVHGTAFLLPVDAPVPASYLLTAAHVIHGIGGAERKIVLVDSDQNRLSAEVVQLSSPEYPDLALLRAEPTGRLPPVCAAAPEGGSEFLTRGCPSGVATSMATMHGWVYGVEKTDGRQLLDVALDDVAAIEAVPDGNSSNPTHAALRGLSGAAVDSSHGSGAPYVSGVLVRRNTRGLASRLYAIPVTVVAEWLAEAGYHLDLLSTSAAALTPPAEDANRHWLGGLLRRDGGLHSAWIEVFAMFVQGIRMDVLLADIIAQPGPFGPRDGIELNELRFILARIQQKRNMTRDARALLRTVLEQSEPTTARSRELAALTRLRLLTMSPTAVYQEIRWQAFERALGRFGDTDVEFEPFKAYEMASAIGVEAGRLCISQEYVAGEPGPRAAFDGLRLQHDALLEAHFDSISSGQEIVNTGLRLFRRCWDREVRSGLRGDLALLAQAANAAEETARRYENAIFLTQALLAQSLLHWQAGSLDVALIRGYSAARALAVGGLGLSHEGVVSVMAPLGALAPDLRELIKMFRALELDDALQAGRLRVASRSEPLDRALVRVMPVLTEVGYGLRGLKDALNPAVIDVGRDLDAFD